MRRAGFILAFLGPAVAVYGLFVVWPLAQAFLLSLYRWRGVSAKRTFVGLDNFKELVGDAAFGRALGNNLWLLLGAGLALFALAIVLALAMQRAGRLARSLRAVYLFPQVVSLVVVAVLWQFLYNPSFGLIDSGLRAVGSPTLERGWLGDLRTALPAVGVALVWYALGFYVMLFSTGLKQIPEEVMEAAELDGARGARLFWSVSWPLLWSVRRVAAVYVVITVMNTFALVHLMTAGGPDRRTEVMLTYLYEAAFENSKFGYATALAVANFAVAMALSMLLLWWTRRNPEAVRA